MCMHMYTIKRGRVRTIQGEWDIHQCGKKRCARPAVVLIHVTHTHRIVGREFGAVEKDDQLVLPHFLGVSDLIYMAGETEVLNT